MDVSRFRDELPGHGSESTSRPRRDTKFILIMVNVHEHAAGGFLPASKNGQGPRGVPPQKNAFSSGSRQGSLCLYARRTELYGKSGEDGLHDVTAYTL
jgi:hypothetical protein